MVSSLRDMVAFSWSRYNFWNAVLWKRTAAEAFANFSVTTLRVTQEGWVVTCKNRDAGRVYHEFNWDESQMPSSSAWVGCETPW